MTESRSGVITGEISEEISIDSNADDDPCCAKIKELLALLVKDHSPPTINDLPIQDFDCAVMRECLEEDTLRFQGNHRNNSWIIEWLLEVWDECLASRNPDWVDENS